MWVLVPWRLILLLVEDIFPWSEGNAVGFPASVSVVDSSLVWSDARITSPLSTISARFLSLCGTYFSICSIKGWPFIIEGDSLVFSTLPARFHEPNSAFLWKTAVILIDEIQRCPKQSRGSPTVAHRRGAPVLSLFPGKKGARPENTRGKNHDFQFKRARKAAFLYRQWESGGKPFHLQTTTILAWLFFPLLMHSAIKPWANRNRATIMNWLFLLWGLMLFVLAPVQLNGWCDTHTSPCIHPICAYRLIVCHVAAQK